MFGRTTGMQPKSFHTIYSHGSWKVLSHMYFLFYLDINPILVVRFFFCKDLRDHQYGSGNFFHDHNHDQSSFMSTRLG